MDDYDNPLAGKKLRYLIGASDEDLREQGIELKTPKDLIMWKNFEGIARSREETAARIASLNWSDWKPQGITLHNTAAPTLAQWAESGPSHDARIRNLQSYYENELGWHAGPHWFVSRNWINWFSNPLLQGVHSRCYNATRFGIEMVGDFNAEPFNSGDGAMVRDNAVFLIACLNRKFGFKAEDIVFHVDCKQDNHDCPGKNVTKADVIARVKAEMARLDGAPTVPVPVVPVPIPPPAVDKSEQRSRMARAIMNFEARRDRNGHLAVYNLPANDGGGRYEVAGLNEKYDKPALDRLVALLNAGKYAEAEAVATEAIAVNTDIAARWTTIPAIEFYLRDCVFNRGQGGAARILQRAVGVLDDGRIGDKTRAAQAIAERNPQQLLQRLRVARESYERDVVGYRANFWNGLVNRWNAALVTARAFPMAAPSAPAPLAPPPPPTPAKSDPLPAAKLGLGAALAATAAGAMPWFGAHPVTTGAVVTVAALLLAVAFAAAWVNRKSP